VIVVGIKVVVDVGIVVVSSSSPPSFPGGVLVVVGLDVVVGVLVVGGSVGFVEVVDVLVVGGSSVFEVLVDVLVGGSVGFEVLLEVVFGGGLGFGSVGSESAGASSASLLLESCLLSKP
jgi:hypothetical protein